MENQIEKSSEINVKGIILLVGTILGALTACIAAGTFLGVVKGLIGGLIFGALFITFILPRKTHDR